MEEWVSVVVDLPILIRTVWCFGLRGVSEYSMTWIKLSGNYANTLLPSTKYLQHHIYIYIYTHRKFWMVNWGKDMEDSEVTLPLRVERMIENICLQQCKPLPNTDARRILACIGEHNSIHLLKIISQARIRCINGFINYLSKDYTRNSTESHTSVYLSPPHHSVSSESGTCSFLDF